MDTDNAGCFPIVGKLVSNTCQLPEEDSFKDAFKTAGVAIPTEFDGSKKSFTLSPPSEKCSAIGVLLFGKINTCIDVVNIINHYIN